MSFRFPPDGRWNPERSAVEFSIGVGEYEGVTRVPRRVFQQLLSESPTPALRPIYGAASRRFRRTNTPYVREANRADRSS